MRLLGEALIVANENGMVQAISIDGAWIPHVQSARVVIKAEEVMRLEVSVLVSTVRTVAPGSLVEAAVTDYPEYAERLAAQRLMFQDRIRELEKRDHCPCEDCKRARADLRPGEPV